MCENNKEIIALSVGIADKMTLDGFPATCDITLRK